MPIKKILVKKAKPEKASKKELESRPSADPWTIIQYPNLSEKSIGAVESSNKLVFIVNEKATKPQIKWAVQKIFDVKVIGVNVVNDRRNRKKAYVRLDPKNSALDIATRMGMI